MKKSFKYSVLIFTLVFSIILTMPGYTGVSVYGADGDETDSADESAETETPEEKAQREKAAADAAKKAETERKNKELQDQIAKIEQDLKELAAEQNKIAANIQSTKGEAEKKQAEVTYIDGQISNTKAEINSMEARIGLLEESITLQEEMIKDKKEEYEKNYDIFKKRVRALYMYDNTTVLGLVLGTDSFIDFLTTSDNLSAIAAHDEKLMQELDTERRLLEEEMENLESTKTDVEASKVETESKRKELDQRFSVAQSQVYEITALQQQFEKDYAASKAQSDAMRAEMNAIYAQIKLSEEEYVGGVMAWPTPGSRNITSTYGWRFNNTDFHTGIDLAAPHGSTVIAANSGEVALVNTSYTPGRGYGIYVIVDHGGGMTTLYAHLSAVSVSKGQKVSRGDAIASVGSTGWSTGPHLHFEVRENKNHKDPYPYIS